METRFLHAPYTTSESRLVLPSKSTFTVGNGTIDDRTISLSWIPNLALFRFSIELDGITTAYDMEGGDFMLAWSVAALGIDPFEAVSAAAKELLGALDDGARASLADDDHEKVSAACKRLRKALAGATPAHLDPQDDSLDPPGTVE